MAVLILMFLIVAVVAIFSVQNAAPVSFHFLFWRFEASLAIVVFLTLVFGGIAGAGAASLFRIKKRLKKQRGSGGDAG